MSRGYKAALALGALVLGAVVVGLSRPRSSPPPRPLSAPNKVAMEAPMDAFFEIAVATPLSEAELSPWAERKQLLTLLPRIVPGGADDSPKGKLREQIRALLGDERSSSFEVMSAERYLLPPEEDAEQIAKELSLAERQQFFASRSVLVLRLRGPGGPPHAVARAGFGLAATLAEELHGLIDDEVRRRVETPAIVRAREVLPEVPSAFVDEAIALEFEPDDEDGGGQGRLLTLGMRRFGAPDLELRALAPTQAAAGAKLLTAIARVLAERRAPASLQLQPAQLGLAAGEEAVTVRLTPAPMSEGNPENEVRTVVVEGGAARVLALMSQGAPEVQSEAEFAARRQAVGAGLPALLGRWKKSGGTLHVLADFAVGDAGVEAMWVEVRELSERELRGTLANEPAYALSLHMGDEVRLPQPVLTGARLSLGEETVSLP